MAYFHQSVNYNTNGFEYFRKKKSSNKVNRYVYPRLLSNMQGVQEHMRGLLEEFVILA
jgi:hypothetical protein